MMAQGLKRGRSVAQSYISVSVTYKAYLSSNSEHQSKYDNGIPCKVV